MRKDLRELGKEGKWEFGGLAGLKPDGGRKKVRSSLGGIVFQEIPVPEDQADSNIFMIDEQKEDIPKKIEPEVKIGDQLNTLKTQLIPHLVNTLASNLITPHRRVRTKPFALNIQSLKKAPQPEPEPNPNQISLPNLDPEPNPNPNPNINKQSPQKPNINSNLNPSHKHKHKKVKKQQRQRQQQKKFKKKQQAKQAKQRKQEEDRRTADQCFMRIMNFFK